MVPFKQTSVKLKQIVHGIRWVFGALQRELCHIYPQDGENEKSSRWAESPNLLPTEHPRPLEVSPPTRKSKTCVQEKENIGVLSNPKTLVKNKITWVKVVGRNGGSRRWHKEGGSWLESGSHSRKLQWSRNRLSMALDGFWDSPKRALPYLPPRWGKWEKLKMGGVPKLVANRTSTATGGLVAYWKIQDLCKREREHRSLELPKDSCEKQNNPSKSGGAKWRE